MNCRFLALLLVAAALTGCAAHGEEMMPTRITTSANEPYSARGKASFYGPGFDGKKTASGETFDKKAMTSAHKNLAFGTKLRVTNVKNGKSVVVRVNDRFGGTNGRVIDLSESAFARIADLKEGVIDVELQEVAE